MNKNIWKHFKLVTKHRWYVFKNCCYAGMPIRGFCHDLSKYSPIEFCESVKYFVGNDSPINECKRQNGYSIAWQHHKGHNPHHWEYWIDDIGNGGEGHPKAVLMPYKYAAELICDYIGAGQAYEKENWTPTSQYMWWVNKRNHCLMHPAIYHFVDQVLWDMKVHPNIYRKFLKKTYLRRLYNDTVHKYN